ncbi:MAG: hypothetical protein AAFZ65_10695, partial [Planctomycetota bacterium]
MRLQFALASLLTTALLTPESTAQVVAHERTLDVSSNVFEPFFDGTDSAADNAATTLDGLFSVALDATSIVPFMSAAARADQNSVVEADAFDFSAQGVATAGIAVQGSAAADALNTVRVDLFFERSGNLLLDGELSVGTSLGPDFGFDPHGTATAELIVSELGGTVLFERRVELLAGQFAGQAVQLGEALALGAGSYVLEITAVANDATVGIEEVVGSFSVAQFDLDAELELVDPLAADVGAIDATFGGSQAFTLDVGPAIGSEIYWLFGSVSGTAPGIAAGGVVLPLNPDAYFTASIAQANQGPFVSTQGQLDVFGIGSAALSVPAGAALPLVGTTLHHALLARSRLPPKSNTTNAWCRVVPTSGRAAPAGTERAALPIPNTSSCP